MRHPRRPGLSLTEVLVALFVMALGLIALLTLFPLGAMQIGQALKDDRTAQTANQADAWVRTYWRDAVAPLANNPNTPGDRFLWTLDDPNLFRVEPGSAPGQLRCQAIPAPRRLPVGVVLNTNPMNVGFMAPDTSALPDLRFVSSVDADTSEVNFGARSVVASFPVLLDPLGHLARPAGVRDWVGKDSVGAAGGVYGTAPAATPLLLPRRTTVVTPDTNRDACYATCALTDDLTYQANGGAGQGEQLNRQGRYNWAALIQRPDNSRPGQANLTVLVFDGRPPFLASPGDEVVLTNGATGTYHALDAGLRSITLNVPTRGADQAPLVRRGGWITLARIEAGTAGVRQVSFHRVTGLTELEPTTATPANTTPMALDIDPPAQPVMLNAGLQVYLLAGLSEVFSRAMLDGN